MFFLTKDKLDKENLVESQDSPSLQSLVDEKELILKSCTDVRRFAWIAAQLTAFSQFFWGTFGLLDAMFMGSKSETQILIIVNSVEVLLGVILFSGLLWRHSKTIVCYIILTTAVLIISLMKVGCQWVEMKNSLKNFDGIAIGCLVWISVHIAEILMSTIYLYSAKFIEETKECEELLTGLCFRDEINRNLKKSTDSAV